MRYIIWGLRVALFVALLGFALKNDHPVTLRYFMGYEWNTSLVVISLIFFAVGIAVGIFAMLRSVLQQRRELAATRHELQLRNKLEQAKENSRLPVQPS